MFGPVEKLAVGEAEQRVFWAVEAALERGLVEPLARDLRDLVEQARQRILAK